VNVEDGVPISVRGDPSDPVYGGYSCIKGRQLPALFSSPDRVRRTLKRQPDDSHAEIATSQAVDEIADKVQQLIESHGPRSVATYLGSLGYYNTVTPAISKAWHKSIGSISYYSSITIDQSAKFVARSRFGSWGGGSHGFTGADVCMLFGNNPLVSHFSNFGGVPPFSPSVRLRKELKRGLKLIVVDPRQTETAKRATMHLQIKPGEDAVLLCGLINLILQEQLHDHDFCAAHVEGLDAIGCLVSQFPVPLVSERCGIPAQQLVEAARIFARAAKGVAVSGTGPDFAPNAVLSEHLLLVINTICGRYNREGEAYPNPGILQPCPEPRAEVRAPRRVYGGDNRARVRGLAQMYGEMPTATLADEILLEGEGQIKALICLGGNPVVAFPDQDKTVAAMKKLELLVCLDVNQTPTTRYAHYVIPPTFSLARDDATLLTDSWYEEPYAHYCKAIVPREAESLEEWELYWEISRRSGIPIQLRGGEISTAHRPEIRELMQKIMPYSRVSLDELAAKGAGHTFRECEVIVGPAGSDQGPRFDLLPDNVAAEIGALLEVPAMEAGHIIDDGQHFTHLLISRRLKHRFNSSGHLLPELRKKGETNVAYLNQEDLHKLGIRAGDLVQIKSAAGTLTGVAEAANDLKPGVVSMAHAWGDAPEYLRDVRSQGASTNRLVDDDRTYDRITGQPRMTAIPVNVIAVADGGIGSARPSM
jgi:anaerobic selenocysteine-containing dehydrogenase